MRDNARYEYAMAVTQAEEAEDACDREDLYAIAAGMAREAIRAICKASDGRPDAMLLLMMRGSGMSLREIARALGRAHPPVMRRLKRLAKRHPEMADYIRSGNPLDLYTELTKDAKDKTTASQL
ncbi:MAG: winged helix-turn-helix domain-containing protein [Victivallales bacterium]|nr:winged helix-turn-helix domain-containing protein [Victivallales bacterium]